jgi:cell division protease FtsH
MNGFWKQISVWVVMLILVLLVVSQFGALQHKQEKLGEFDFEEQLEKANIKSPVVVTTISDNLVSVHAPFKNEVKSQPFIEFQTNEFPAEWKNALKTQGVSLEVREQNVFWLSLLSNVIPLVIIIGVFWFFMFRQMQGGSNKAHVLRQEPRADGEPERQDGDV